MAEKLPVPDPKPITSSATPITSLPEDEEKLHATLEERIYNIVGSELLEQDFKPTAYAEAVMTAAGDQHKIIYNYAKIRYKDLYNRATRRLKHTNELKG